MSGTFDVTASINSLLARTMRSPEEKAAAFTQVSMILDIPMKMADAKQSEGLALEQRNNALAGLITAARSRLATIEEQYNAGTVQQYAVTEAQDELDDLITERAANRRIVNGIRSFHASIVDQAGALLQAMR